MTSLTTALHERTHGETAAPRRVLFVCTGNTCRSPMAATILSHKAAQETPCRFVAESGGLFAAEGEPMTPHAVHALAALGIEPPAHRARNVTEELVNAADVVVGLTASHAMQLTMRYPHAATKIVTLPMDIADPFGGDAEVYAFCAEQLSFGIELAFFGEEP